MSKKEPMYRQILREEFEMRKNKNKQYSLRAYARDLDIDSSSLSAIMRGKRGLPAARAAHFAEKLDLHEDRLESFLAEVENEKLSLNTLKNRGLKEIIKMDEEDNLEILINWEPLSIFVLMDSLNRPLSSEYIAEKLGMEEDIVVESLKYLEKSAIAEQLEDGRWVDIREDIWLETKNWDLEKLSTKNELEAAIERLNESKEEDVFLPSLTFALSEKDLKEVKALVNDFYEKIFGYMVKNPKVHTDIYRVFVQLFPLD